MPAGRGVGRGGAAIQHLEREPTVQQLLGENNVDNSHGRKYTVLSYGEKHIAVMVDI